MAREANVAEPREPTWHPGGAEVARTRGTATRVYADAQVVPRGMRGASR